MLWICFCHCTSDDNDLKEFDYERYLMEDIELRRIVDNPSLSVVRPITQLLKPMFILWKVHQVVTKTILISLNNQNNILFINVSTSHRKSSSVLNSGTGRQYVKACPIHGSIGSSPRLDSWRKSHWSRIRQSWQTYKGGNKDQEDRQHESRQGELPIEPHMGQAFTYWRPVPEVSPDEDFRCRVETSIISMLFWVFRVINIANVHNCSVREPPEQASMWH